MNIKSNNFYNKYKYIIPTFFLSALMILPLIDLIGKNSKKTSDKTEKNLAMNTETLNALIDNSVAIDKQTQDYITPAKAMLMLKEGNKRFVERNMLDRDFQQQISKTAMGQFPFATVLGCIDSRVPAEIVFDQGLGDIFNVRIAGNFVNSDILGSMEFACKVAGSKLIVVLGHESCGAIKGACDDVQMGNLTHLLSNLKPAVNAADQSIEDRSSANAEFVQEVAVKNVQLTIQDIYNKSPELREMVAKGEIDIVGAMYDVETGMVRFLETDSEM